MSCSLFSTFNKKVTCLCIKRPNVRSQSINRSIKHISIAPISPEVMSVFNTANVECQWTSEGGYHKERDNKMNSNCQSTKIWLYTPSIVSYLLIEICFRVHNDRVDEAGMDRAICHSGSVLAISSQWQGLGGHCTNWFWKNPRGEFPHASLSLCLHSDGAWHSSGRESLCPLSIFQKGKCPRFIFTKHVSPFLLNLYVHVYFF